MGKVVIVKFQPKAGVGSDEVGADMRRIMAFEWSGEKSVPLRIEWELGLKTPLRFPLSPVAYTPEDADALLASLEYASAVVLAEDNPEREAVQKPRSILKKMPAVVPAAAGEVHPKVRLLCCEEEMAEGKRMYREMQNLRGIGLAWLADRLQSDYPLIARADHAIGGGISRVLREAATITLSPTDPIYWLSIAVGIGNGHPEHLVTWYHEGRKRETSTEYALRKIAEHKAARAPRV